LKARIISPLVRFSAFSLMNLHGLFFIYFLFSIFLMFAGSCPYRPILIWTVCPQLNLLGFTHSLLLFSRFHSKFVSLMKNNNLLCYTFHFKTDLRYKKKYFSLDTGRKRTILRYFVKSWANQKQWNIYLVKRKWFKITSSDEYPSQVEQSKYWLGYISNAKAYSCFRTMIHLKYGKSKMSNSHQIWLHDSHRTCCLTSHRGTEKKATARYESDLPLRKYINSQIHNWRFLASRKCASINYTDGTNISSIWRTLQSYHRRTVMQ